MSKKEAVVETEEEKKEKKAMSPSQRIASVMAKINKAHGERTIIKLGETSAEPTPHFQTNILTLDVAMGIGGIPRGRIGEIYGPESSGKTSLTLHIGAEVQKQGGIVAIIDAEQTIDRMYCAAMGMDVNSLLFVQPESAEQAFDIIHALIDSGSVDLIIVDSLAALVPKCILDGDMADITVGAQARVVGKGIAKSLGKLATLKKTRPEAVMSAIIFINQLRSTIGQYGNPETTPGGKSLKYYASFRYNIRIVEAIKRGDVRIGNRLKVTVVKNKVAPPNREAEFNIIFGRGVDSEGTLVDVGLVTGVLSMRGSWIWHGEEKLENGRDKTKELLKTDTLRAAIVEQEIRQKVHGEITNYVPEPDLEDDTDVEVEDAA